MAKIYISYAHADADLALAVAQGLKNLGHELTFDVESLSPGDEWRGVLAEGLKNSQVFVALVTEQSLMSSYVLTEIGTARAFMEASKKMLVIPVVFDNLSIPPAFADIMAIRAARNDIGTVVQKIESGISAFQGRRAADELEEGEVKKRVEANANTFITKALTSLKNNEQKNRNLANLWYGLGYAGLLLGFGFAAYGAISPQTFDDQHWVNFAASSLHGLLIIGLLVASSKYAFTLGKSFMHEALKNADRTHAISFGEFYLGAYGQKAEWSELKEVFQHWNIDKASAFQALDANQFDPKFIESLAGLVKAIKSSKEE